MLVRIELAHMGDMELSLRMTQARRHFKSRAGQNNHFLITALVGLDSVLDPCVKINEEFSTSWSPHDRVHSYHRSRQYVLETSLAWITDLIDGYRRSVSRLPGVFGSGDLAAINRTEGGAKKLHLLRKLIGLEQTDAELIISVAWAMRNRIVHGESATKRVSGDISARLREHAEQVSARYRGLDVDVYIANAEGEAEPTFKETASTIAAAHEIVQEIDEAVLSRLPHEQLAEFCVARYLCDSFEQGRRSVFAEYWPGSPAKSERRLRQLLLQHGWSPARPAEGVLSSDWIEGLTSLSASEARARLTAVVAQP